VSVSLHAFQRAAELLQSASRPLLFLGEGVSDSDRLLQLVQRLGAAVALSPGCDDPHPELVGHSIGRYSFGHSPAAARIVERADLVLGVNIDFSEFLSRGCRDFTDKTVIHVFERERDFLRGIRPALSIRSAPEPALRDLLQALQWWSEPPRPLWCNPRKDEPARDAAAPGTIHPREVVRVLQSELPAELTLAVDVGGFTAHVLSYLELERGHRLFCPIERAGVMGEAILAALGLHDAEPDRRVLVIVGDGGFAMVPPEIQRAAESRARLTLLVWQNLGFQAVEEGFRATWGADHGLPSGVWHGQPPDFAKIAEGWGAEAHVARCSDTLRSALRQAFAADGPVVVVANVDPTVVSPMHDRFDQVRSAG
jgi:thiamine pyrophosphate-dependent acetolactate synthase large subunit-like protein